MYRIFLLFAILLYSQSAISLEDKIKCADKICKDESCYEKDFGFTDINRDKSNKAIIESSKHYAEYFKDLTLENNLIDVTEKVLNDEKVKVKTKAAIRKHNRRIVVFLYPSDGLMVPGFISYPKDSEKYNLIVNLRGGNRKFGIAPPYSMSSYGINNILSTQYRGSLGEGRDEFGGNDVNDVNNLINFIPNLEKRLNKKFTTRNKYLLGHSRGGMQAFLALARFTKLQEFFDKAILNAGSLDVGVSIKNRAKMREMFKSSFALTENNKDMWVNRRAAKYHIDKIKKNFPILIIQGTKDNRVSLEHGAPLYYLMKESGHNITYWEVKNATHCLMNCNDRLEIFDEWLLQQSSK